MRFVSCRRRIMHRAAMGRCSRMRGATVDEVDEADIPVADVQIFEVEDCLLVAIREDLDDRAVMELQDRLTERISRTHARGVLIDISALDVVDTFIGRMLGSIARMAAIPDAASVLAARKSVVEGKSVSVRVDPVGRRINKKK